MRYSLEPRKRKYTRLWFFLICYKFGYKYGKKLEIDAAETASEKVFQKTAVATRDLIWNKIADKITSADKTKSKEKEDGKNEIEKIYVPPETQQQIIDDLRFY